jgi:hypothetical protein
MTTSDRFMAAGGVVAGLGGALGVGYFIYSIESNESFWAWPGWVSIVVTLTGLTSVVLGLFRRDDRLPAQTQRVGRNSTNYQAGRDINIDRTPNVD